MSSDEFVRDVLTSADELVRDILTYQSHHPVYFRIVLGVIAFLLLGAVANCPCFRSCCVSGLGDGEPFQGSFGSVIGSELDLDKALLVGESVWAPRLPPPFCVLPPCLGRAYFCWCRMVRLLEPCVPFSGWETHTANLTRRAVCCEGFNCIEELLWTLPFLLLSVVKIPVVAAVVAVGYLLPTQAAFACAFPRYFSHIMRSIAGCSHWGCGLRFCASLGLLPILLVLPPLQLFGCLWFALGLSFFLSIRWTYAATSIWGALFGFGRAAADAGRAGAAYLALIELALQQVRVWSSIEARPGERGFYDLSCTGALAAVLVGGVGLLTVTPTIALLMLLKSPLYLLKTFELYGRAILKACTECHPIVIVLVSPMIVAVFALAPLGWLLITVFWLLAAVGLGLSGAVASYFAGGGDGRSSSGFCMALCAGLELNLAAIVTADRFSDLGLMWQPFDVFGRGSEHFGIPPPVVCAPCACLVRALQRRRSAAVGASFRRPTNSLFEPLASHTALILESFTRQSQTRDERDEEMAQHSPPPVARVREAEGRVHGQRPEAELVGRANFVGFALLALLALVVLLVREARIGARLGIRALDRVRGLPLL